MKWRLVKALVFVLLLAAIGLVGYAYVGPIFFAADFAAPTEVITQPVTLGGSD